MSAASCWLLLALLGAPASSADATDPSLFNHDRSVPLALRVQSTSRRGEVTVRKVSFAGRSPRERVTGLMVLPAGPGPYPAVLYVHWLGVPATSNSTEFLDEAVGMARFGVLSLLVDAAWSPPGWFHRSRFEDDFALSVRQVVELRRAMDVLLSQTGVDPRRMALVGHDFGAMYGVLAGAVDPRPRAYVLLAGAPTFHEWFLLRERKPKDMAAYLEQMEVLDVTRWIGRLAPAPVLLQSVRQDEYVPLERAQKLIDATSEPKLARFYDTDHAMQAKDTVGERFRWLAKQLELPEHPLPVNVTGAGTPRP